MSIPVSLFSNILDLFDFFYVGLYEGLRPFIVRRERLF